MKKPELLSPAGNFACLKAAIAGGADAVYLGGKNFSARAFANNFDNEQLEQAVRYAHLRGVRIFVTLNTLLNEKEFENALKMADFYYRSNVDALLIQDLGLYYVLKEKYPDFELHCSTQMHVHNLSGVINAKKLGFKRVVLARESDLELIRQCCRQGIEVEVFVHGAICVSYSGQCLMSSYSKTRSANKGMCAQCCRLKYDLYEDDKKVKTDTKYLLSPKDNCLIEDIPDLIEAGVSSFKIEGRMKSSAYVGYVTSLYRKAIDEYFKGSRYRLSQDELDKLRVLFNRNFSDDLLHDRNELFGQKTPNHLGIETGEVLYNKNDHTYIRLSRDLNQFDGIRIGDFGCIVNMLYKDGLLVSHASKGEIVSILSKEKLSGRVFKTQDYILENTVNSLPEKRIPLDVKLSIYPNRNVEVNLKCLDDNYTFQSSITAQKALKAPLNKETVIRQFQKLNDTEYFLNDLELNSEDAFLSVSQLNEIRRNAIEQFNKYRLGSFKRDRLESGISLADLKDETDEGEMIQNGDRIFLNDKEYPVNYVINKESRYADSTDGAICEFGGLLKDYRSKIAYYTLNICNSYAYEFLKRLGFDHIVLSSELKDNEISDLIEAYETRNKRIIKPYRLFSGKRVLMYIKSDPLARYAEKGHKYTLDDGNNRYDVNFVNNIMEISVNMDKSSANDGCLALIIES